MPDVKDWKRGECDLIPGKKPRREPDRGRARLSKHLQEIPPQSGPLLDKLGNGGKGIGWNTEHEVEALAAAELHGAGGRGFKGRPCISSDIDAAEMIMMLAPETNGHVAVKAWAALGKITASSCISHPVIIAIASLLAMATYSLNLQLYGLTKK